MLSITFDCYLNLSNLFSYKFKTDLITVVYHNYIQYTCQCECILATGFHKIFVLMMKHVIHMIPVMQNYNCMQKDWPKKIYFL